MTDLGSFSAETQSMREQATFWSDRATNADDGRLKIVSGWGKGYQFGFLAGKAPADVTSQYNTWVSAMFTAALDASTTATYLKAAMDSAANAYDGADNTVATDMATLDKMIEES